MTVNDGAARLLRNEAGRENNVLRVHTMGTASNRDGIGARVEVTVGDGPPRGLLVKTGSSYASQSELALTFGLGAAAVADIVRVVWPSGQIDTVRGVTANQQITIREGAGIVEASPLGY